MLTDREFDLWCRENSIIDLDRQLIEKIRSAPPSRHVEGRRGNVCGRYPSRKMGCTIQYESHRVELAKIYLLERDCNTLEYYDQPPPIKLNYEGKNGKRLGFLHTPDFFVIEVDGCGWIECKTEEQLKKLEQKNPNRYYRHKDFYWRCPPGEKYARQLGFFYRVCSDKDFNWILQRNLIYLDDYFRNPSPSIEESTKELIISTISEQAGITIAELLNLGHKFIADDINNLIITNEIYVDLETSLLAEPRRVRVFCDKQTAKAYQLVSYESSINSNFDINSPVVHIVVGSQICWDGKGLKILHAGESEITLVDENDQPIVLKRKIFEGLVHQGKITNLQTYNIGEIKQEAWEKFQAASPEDQAEAVRRYEIIKPYLEGNPPETETVPKRTIRNWQAKYLKAKHLYNCGLIGLLSYRHSKGNRSRKLPQETLELIENFISEHYETIKQKNMRSVYGSLLLLCEEKGALEPSYVTFTKEVNKRSSYEQTKARQGRRAAYQHKKFYWELSRTTPRHGDRPFEIGHIDHTEADIELVSSETGRKLDRPWLTLLTDAYSRRILAIYLTFDRPSYRSCLMVLRVCVKRYGRLPQTIVVDNGAEFGSTYFETLLATFECNKKQRPPAQARFGSVCERLFGTTNTQFFYNLKGNTQITRNVRQVTKSVNPKNHAVWTLVFLYEYLCCWAYEIYDTTDHPALDQTPQEAFAQGMLQGGERTHRMISYNKDFCLLTLPTTSKGKAKLQPGHGVKINYIYYWSNLFRDPELEKTWIPIKYDPFNIGIAYAYVKGQWIECVSQYYADFQGHSEKELKLASTELRKRNQNHSKSNKVSAKKLAKFIASAEGQEFLLEQRSRDLETQQVIQVIEGNLSPLSQHLKNSNPEKATQVTQDFAKPEFYEISESSCSIEDDDDDFDIPFDELEIYDEF